MEVAVGLEVELAVGAEVVAAGDSVFQLPVVEFSLADHSQDFSFVL